MKKQKIWLTIFLALIPLVILPIFFLTSDMDVSVFAVLMVFATIISAIPITMFALRKKDTLSSQKRRKQLLIIFGCYIAFLLILTIASYLYRGRTAWQEPNYAIILQVFFTTGIFLYAFFRKDKKEEEQVPKK